MSNYDDEKALFFIESLLDALKGIEKRGLTISESISGLEKSLEILRKKTNVLEGGQN